MIRAFIEARCLEDQIAIDTLLSALATRGERVAPDNAEQVRRTRRAGGRVGTWISCDVDGQDIWVGKPHPEAVDYASRWDPGRAQEEVNATLNLLDIHHETEGHVCDVCVTVEGSRPVPEPWPCRTVRLLAWRWVDHDDFQEEWGAV